MVHRTAPEPVQQESEIHQTVREVSEVAPQLEIPTHENAALPSCCCYDELVVLTADILVVKQDTALEKLLRLLSKYTLEKDIAEKLKKRMEKVYKGHWSCIVGSSFGCIVSYVEHEYLQVRVGHKEIVLYKTG